MSILSKSEKLFALICHPGVFTCRVNHLFIFSHMRSRSSVLSHVLGSHSEICGYGESFRSYANRLDLLKLRMNLFLDLREDIQDKYLLDKLLHNHLHMSDYVLDKTNPKIIFLLREPESTFKSILKMAADEQIEELMNPQFVLQYYCSRLAELERFASLLKRRFFFIDSDDLVDHTEAVLGKLTLWLGLQESLMSNYSTFRNTGKPGVGDTSNNIQSGKIIKTKLHDGIQISPDIVQKGRLAYETCRVNLIRLSGIGGA